MWNLSHHSPHFLPHKSVQIEGRETFLLPSLSLCISAEAFACRQTCCLMPYLCSIVFLEYLRVPDLKQRSDLRIWLLEWTGAIPENCNSRRPCFFHCCQTSKERCAQKPVLKMFNVLAKFDRSNDWIQVIVLKFVQTSRS